MGAQMSTRKAGSGEDPPIESREDLISVFSGGEKTKEKWRIGTEHEKFAYSLKDRKPLPYLGRPGIRVLLEGMQRHARHFVVAKLDSPDDISKA